MKISNCHRVIFGKKLTKYYRIKLYGRLWTFVDNLGKVSVILRECNTQPQVKRGHSNQTYMRHKKI